MEAEAVSLSDSMDSVTAIRVKAERDQALKLLREVLHLSTLGSEGDYKTRVRSFLARLA